MIWIDTYEAMRETDNPLVRRVAERGPIGFVHVIPNKWTMRAVYEYAIAQAWEAKLAPYRIPVRYVSEDEPVDALRYGRDVPRVMLFDHEAVRTGQGTPYKKFTPFYKKAKTHAWFQETDPVEWTVQDERAVEPSIDVRMPQWAANISLPPVTEEEAHAFLQTRSLTDYAERRDFIEHEAVTRLSPLLATGLVTPRTVLRYGLDEEAFVRQLVWREFAHMTLREHPDARTHPLNEAYATFPWRHDDAQFQAWCEGKTGYPIVDAAMRELYATGYMHNRLRMVVASFLTKHLRIDWRWGERYFMETLLDADAANNAINWQWVAGVGVDSSPYFRIFNPIKQGKDFAPSGTYIRRWCPEVIRPHAIQPGALIGHEAARSATMEAYEEWKANASS